MVVDLRDVVYDRLYHNNQDVSEQVLYTFDQVLGLVGISKDV